MNKPTIVTELIRSNSGYDEGELVLSLWKLYVAVRDEHSGQHFEPECPECIAVLEIARLSSENET